VGGFRSFTDFAAWQHAYALRRAVLPLCRRAIAARDYKLHDQVREAARSGPRNIAEGFGRYRHREFAQFVRIARGSELELLNHLQEAFDSGHLNDEEYRELEEMARKAIAAATGLIRYLESSPDPLTALAPST
jgi:four helix bundle protein